MSAEQQQRDRSRAGAWARQGARVGITLVTLAAAAWAGWHLWDHYERAPWTRDGRVRANVVAIAPDVSGLVTAVNVHDNEPVEAGALLFEVDPARYRLAVRQGEAAVAAQEATLAEAQREDRRNRGLGNLVSQEQREQARAKVQQAEAAVAQARVNLDSARLNLQRAQVHAPSAGQITNLDLRTGAYASAGKPVLALVDNRALYVEGYFEETKLPRIHVGDRVTVTPMGGQALQGTVQSIAAGIADRDRTTAGNLLSSVNPTFNWVRLAQRIPVRVHLDDLPAGRMLVAGQTVTVAVSDSGTTTDRPAVAEARPQASNTGAAAAAGGRSAIDAANATHGAGS